MRCRKKSGTHKGKIEQDEKIISSVENINMIILVQNLKLEMK